MIPPSKTASGTLTVEEIMVLSRDTLPFPAAAA